MATSTTTVHSLSRSSSSPKPNKIGRVRAQSVAVRCSGSSASTAEAERVATLKSGNDSLEICRVLNGMWQTSGGWGRIDRNDAVDAMLRYADAGLSTFDMADHCTLSFLSYDCRFLWFFVFALAFLLLCLFSISYNVTDVALVCALNSFL